MNILFTGATGFIGQNFIRYFNQYSYTVLSRSTDRAKRKLPNNIHFINTLSTLEDLNKFDAVIDLAGEPIIDKRWTAKQKDTICQSRWDTTAKIVDLIKKSSKPPAVFISGSAIGFYGETNDKTITEIDSAVGHDFAQTICKKWEEIANQAAVQTRLVIIRTGIVLGKDGGALKKMLLPFKLGLGGKVGSGNQYMSWIHIQDMINAIDFLLNNEKSTAAYNLTAPEAVTNNEFTNILADVLGTKPRFPMPEKIIRVILGESADLLLNSQRIYPEKLLKEGFEFKFDNLLSALGNIFQYRG